MRFLVGFFLFALIVATYTCVVDANIRINRVSRQLDSLEMKLDSLTFHTHNIHD